MMVKEVIEKFGPGENIYGEIIEEKIETHISWVLLCPKYVYKIKKPVKLSFLDFSTVELRKKYCDQELFLNKRLAPDMYLDVVPIVERDNDQQEKILDYAVKMKRMDNRREMRRQLKTGQVNPSQIIHLARQIAEFHRTTERIRDKVSPEDLKNDFNDLLQIKDFTLQELGTEKVELLLEIVEGANGFIDYFAEKIWHRSHAGFVRDCHGDLHSGNIFLTDPPVIFDCIEFNDHFRQIDILNEVAFFCMDLEFYGHSDFADLFMQEYTTVLDLTFGDIEKKLFLFYKLYRANVKTKVNAIKSLQEKRIHHTKHRRSLFEQYFRLMAKYHWDLHGHC